MSPVQQAGKPGLVLMIYRAFLPAGCYIHTNFSSLYLLIDRLLLSLRAQPSLEQSSNLNPSAYTQIDTPSLPSLHSNRWRHALLILDSTPSRIFINQTSISRLLNLIVELVFCLSLEKQICKLFYHSKNQLLPSPHLLASLLGAADDK
ncbi:hypothetical protein PGT21_021124 [Puccinia graminis f. sp. tritici]|uniref:Uncharacterized protein n=1 Tax=Puccinia graminis f. sp. tritici TaxID=56615 RepID=A0A5B0PIJ8_PUCGR|nr:hypothetical protein PGT21_021124 [Puccinia graminis f. sp. tritici]